MAFGRRHLYFGILAIALIGTKIVGCTTAEVASNPILPPVPHEYIKVPHPIGHDMSDVRAIFTEPGAPEYRAQETCDVDVKKLRSVTKNQDEVKQGVREFVRLDPVKYHWCFYAYVLALEDQLKKDTYVDERQKHVLETYGFLVPVARAFVHEYHDSRYLRFALYRYRQLSEWVFYRRVDLTPSTTAELTEAANPFGFWRESEQKTEKPILEKYGFLKADPRPETAAAPQPAPAPTPEMVGGQADSSEMDITLGDDSDMDGEEGSRAPASKK